MFNETIRPDIMELLKQQARVDLDTMICIRCRLNALACRCSKAEIDTYLDESPAKITYRIR